MGRFLLLKKTKYSENDLIIQALDMSGAKRSFMARGALKSKKRFGGGILEPTHFVQLNYRESKSETGLSVINEAILVDGFDQIRQDYDKLDFALNMMNCAYHVSQEGDIGSDFLFNLLGHSLRFLDQHKEMNIHVFKLHFYLKFLYQQGVISLDPWMGVFLKVNIADSLPLHQRGNESVLEITHEYLDSIEIAVRNYIKSASI